MSHSLSAWAAVLGALACAPSVACTGDVVDSGEEGLTPTVATGLDAIYDQVSRETGVPADIMKAIGWVETRWQMIAGEAEIEGMPVSIGLMAIRADVADHAAALAQVDRQDLGEDPAANIRAGAALLLEAADRVGPAPADRADLAAWAPAVAEYGRLPDDEARSSYVFGDVYQVLQDGVTDVAESGEVIATLAAHPGLEPDYEYTGAIYAAGTDWSGATWKPSPNYSSRPSGNAGKVAMVIIHTCEGGYSGCVGWLRNTQAGASAHYVVKENGAETSQLVRESSKAWHIAATYKCNLNSNTECARNGASSNNFTVGIEHAGYGSQSSWPTAQIEASARLTCDITQRHGIARDRQHIVGHGQLQPYNRTDPGPNWPWSHYIDRVRTLCGGGGGGGGTPPPTTAAIIIDSNNANNDASKAKIELTGTWTSSNSTSGYYGTGYWYAATKAASEPATFLFYLPSAGSKTIDAWWTSGANRSSAAVFVAQNAAGSEVGRATKNQTTGGGQWVTLGTWNFSAGWNKVVLSRWQAEGKVVIADAVRVR